MQKGLTIISNFSQNTFIVFDKIKIRRKDYVKIPLLSIRTFYLEKILILYSVISFGNKSNVV